MTATMDDRLTQIVAELLEAGITLGQVMRQVEFKTVAAALARSSGNITEAAASLGVHRNTLHNKLRVFYPDKYPAPMERWKSDVRALTTKLDRLVLRIRREGRRK